jgi:hypothetical protein
MPQTIDMTPNWPNMRRWVLHVARTDLAAALKVNASMGCEGVSQEELSAAAAQI